MKFIKRNSQVLSNVAYGGSIYSSTAHGQKAKNPKSAYWRNWANGNGKGTMGIFIAMNKANIPLDNSWYTRDKSGGATTKCPETVSDETSTCIHLMMSMIGSGAALSSAFSCGVSCPTTRGPSSAPFSCCGGRQTSPETEWCLLCMRLAGAAVMQKPASMSSPSSTMESFWTAIAVSKENQWRSRARESTRVCTCWTLPLRTCSRRETSMKTKSVMQASLHFENMLITCSTPSKKRWKAIFVRKTMVYPRIDAKIRMTEPVTTKCSFTSGKLRRRAQKIVLNVAGISTRLVSSTEPVRLHISAKRSLLS
mmetsp:Transcript_36983/g.85335  ORF Transcript_36983/g.85335 Transcript_36983/m.85335 type:complete len:309 (-) Transcript_36983:19-945(-)